MYESQFIKQCFTDGHLGGFHSFATIDNTTVNILIHCIYIQYMCMNLFIEKI